MAESNGQKLDMIVGMIERSNKSIDNLRDALDRKMDIVHNRVTAADKERTTLCERVRGLGIRVNWLYVIVGGVYIAIIGAIIRNYLKS